MEPVKTKWNLDKNLFFTDLQGVLADVQDWSAASIEAAFKEMATARAIKVGELQLPLRLMLVGGKFGPAVFDIAALIGKASTIARIKKGLESLA